MYIKNTVFIKVQVLVPIVSIYRSSQTLKILFMEIHTIIIIYSIQKCKNSPMQSCPMQFHRHRKCMEDLPISGGGTDGMFSNVYVHFLILINRAKLLLRLIGPSGFPGWRIVDVECGGMSFSITFEKNKLNKIGKMDRYK